MSTMSGQLRSNATQRNTKAASADELAMPTAAGVADPLATVRLAPAMLVVRKYGALPISVARSNARLPAAGDGPMMNVLRASAAASLFSRVEVVVLVIHGDAGCGGAIVSPRH